MSNPPVKHLRSSTADKRPTASGLANGRLAINTASGTPGVYFVDNASGVVKVGPAHVGATAPNVTPAGSSGNSSGEQWLDTSGGSYKLKTWDGAAWRTDVISNADVASGAAIALSKLATGALPTGITISSGNIVDGTIANADISNTAEIAVSKLADGTARQVLQTDAAGTGVEWTSNVSLPGTMGAAGAVTFDSTLGVGGNVTISDKIVHSGDSDTAIRFPQGNTVTVETGGNERLRVDSIGRLLMGEITPDTSVAHSICTPGRLESDGTYSITTASAANVFIGTDGLFSRATSSLKYKTNVEDAILDFSKSIVYNSRPVWYRSLSESDPSEYSYWGFIAEEVAEIDPRMVHWGEDGPEGVQYDRYVVHLVNVVQEQKQQLDALESRIAALEAR